MREGNSINFNLYLMDRDKIINGKEHCDEVKNEIKLGLQYIHRALLREEGYGFFSRDTH